MAVDLAHVNISIAQFQEISSGKYNAGEVKLASDGSLAKMNNHVHLWGRNVETISHAETIAIKEAFVRALVSSGVTDAKELDAVRHELGLAPDGAVDRTLSERSMKPLTRQQIREILDRNAAAINDHEGAGTIRTDEMIHAHRSFSRNVGIVEKRDATNAALDGSRAVTASATISQAQTIIAGDVDFHSPKERKELLQAALDQKASIMERSGGRPSTDPGGSLAVKTSEGQTVTLALGMSEADYVGKLDDMIMRLRGPRVPKDRDIAAREEFKALDGPGRDEWLAKLMRAPVASVGAKARAVAVMILQERGIDDFETLSLVNSIGDDPAVTLVHTLLTDTSGLTGDKFRQSGLMGRFVAWAEGHPAKVPDDSKAFIPALSPREFNEAIFKGLSNEPDTLPEPFAKMAREIRDDVAASLGDAAVQPGGSLHDLAANPVLVGLIDHTDEGAARVSPESLRAGLLDGAMEQGARKLLLSHVSEASAKLETPVSSTRNAVNIVLARNPEHLATIAASRTPAEAAAAIANMSGAISSALEFEGAIERCDAAVEGWTLEALSKALDLPVEDLSKPGAVNLFGTTKFSQKLEYMIADGKFTGTSPADVEAAFRGMVADFVNERVETLRAIDKLDISPGARNGLRTAVLQMNKTGYLNFDAIMAAAEEADFSEIVSLIDSNASPDKVFSAMDGYCKRMLGISAQVLAGAHGEIGGDEQGFIATLVNQIAIDMTPGGVEALETFLERKDVPNISNDYTQQAFAASPFREILATRGGETGMRLMLCPLEQTFLSGAGAARAREMGYYQSEMPKLARAFSLCRAAGMSEEDAIAAVTDPTSVPMRLCSYGGRFTASISGFSRGLKLMDDYRVWFAQLCNGMDHWDTSSVTLANAGWSQVHPAAAGGIERFLFEEIAVNGDIPLHAKTAEDIFGMVNNPAMRFIGRYCAQECAVSISHLPPEKRGLVYAVFDAMNPIGRTLSQVDHSLFPGLNAILASRVLANYEAIDALRAGGNLDRAHVIDMLFPEFVKFAASANMRIDTNLGFNEMYDEFVKDLSRDENVPGREGGHFRSTDVNMSVFFKRMMVTSGASVGEVLASMADGGAVPQNQYCTFIRGSNDKFIGEMKSPVAGEREAMFDLLRHPSLPILRATPALAEWEDVKWEGVIADKDRRFVFTFPDGQQIASLADADYGEMKTRESAIAKRLEDLCGPAHQEQLAAVYRALSQNGRGQIVNAFRTNGFRGRGINTDAYCPTSHTISKDEETGAITIRYSQPEGFPVKFSWETTIALDGTTTSTPLAVD